MVPRKSFRVVLLSLLLAVFATPLFGAGLRIQAGAAFADTRAVAQVRGDDVQTWGLDCSTGGSSTNDCGGG